MFTKGQLKHIVAVTGNANATLLAVASCTYGQFILFARRDMQYVTWEYEDKGSLRLGLFFDDWSEAFKDFHTRVAERVLLKRPE